MLTVFRFGDSECVRQLCVWSKARAQGTVTIYGIPRLFGNRRIGTVPGAATNELSDSLTVSILSRVSHATRVIRSTKVIRGVKIPTEIHN